MAHITMPTAAMIRNRLEEIIDAVQSVELDGITIGLPSEVYFSIPREEGVTIGFAIPIFQSATAPRTGD
jgi:hypothetical protein